MRPMRGVTTPRSFAISISMVIETQAYLFLLNKTQRGRLFSTKLRFVKQKKLISGEERDEKTQIDQGKEKEKSSSQQRKFPWPGTTYKVRDLAIEAQFRSTVNPGRKLKQLPAYMDAPFDEVQHFVNHLRIPQEQKRKVRHRKTSAAPVEVIAKILRRRYDLKSDPILRYTWT